MYSLLNRQYLTQQFLFFLQRGRSYLAGLTNLFQTVFRYIHLIPHSRTHPEISTLILCAPDEHGLDELKLLCSAVLQSLKQLLYHPFLVPGAGCFETIMAGLLVQNAQKCDGFQELECCSKRTYSRNVRFPSAGQTRKQCFAKVAHLGMLFDKSRKYNGKL